MDLRVYDIMKRDCVPEKRINVGLLKACTTRLSFAMARGLRWERVWHLYLFGRESGELFPIAEGQLEQGVYVDASGEWVMVYGMDESNMFWYLSRSFRRLSVLGIYNTAVTNMDISMLPQLHGLDIVDNPSLTRLIGLHQQEKLQSLNICNSALKSVRFTENHREVGWLKLNQNAMLEQVQGLEYLQSMTGLELNHTAIKTISLSKPLEKLKYLQCCSTPLEDGTFLTMLPMLDNAWLVNTNLTELPSMNRLHHLHALSVGVSPIRTLEGVELPENLEQLWLDSTKIRSIPDTIRHLKKLRHLLLSGLTLEKLPDWLPELIRQKRQNNEHFNIILRDTTVDGVDMNGLKWIDEGILKWIEDRKAEMVKAQKQMPEIAASETPKPQPVSKAAEPLNRSAVERETHGEAGHPQDSCQPTKAQTEVDYCESDSQKKLIRDIKLACEKLQDRPMYWGVTEDDRTDYIRDLLLTGGYTVLDQHRGGVSTGGERAGELDLDIRLDANACWTILEALNLTGSSPSRLRYWEAHLKKLLDNYNPVGRTFLFHVSYVECKKEHFGKICGDFYEHLCCYSPEGFRLIPGSGREISLAETAEQQNRFMRAFKCIYDCGGASMTVYHFFVRIGSGESQRVEKR